MRARYWDEALRIFGDNPGVGVGAGGYATVRKRYRTADGAVRQAHGYVVQTLSDLGLAGAAVSLALLAAWLASAAAATGFALRRRRRPAAAGSARDYSPERIGLITLVAVVAVFGVHSTIDWTWFVPGNAAVALLAAGWVAGRGPLGREAARGVPGGVVERLRAGLREATARAVGARHRRRGADRRVDGLAAAALRQARAGVARHARARRRRRGPQPGAAGARRQSAGARSAVQARHDRAARA